MSCPARRAFPELPACSRLFSGPTALQSLPSVPRAHTFSRDSGNVHPGPGVRTVFLSPSHNRKTGPRCWPLLAQGG